MSYQGNNGKFGGNKYGNSSNGGSRPSGSGYNAKGGSGQQQDRKIWCSAENNFEKTWGGIECKAKQLPDGTYKVMINGDTFVTEVKQAKESGREYHAFDGFGGKVFVSYLEENEKGPAAIILTLTKDVNIPRPAGSKFSKGKSSGGASNFKKAAAPAAPKPKKTEALEATGDSPW